MEGCVRCSKDKGAQVPQRTPREPVKLQWTAEGRSSTPHLANSSGALHPGRIECLETHCNLIVPEERENGSCQMSQKVGEKG